MGKRFDDDSSNNKQIGTNPYLLIYKIWKSKNDYLFKILFPCNALCDNSNKIQRVAGFE